jgi:hypothetical protein
MNESDNIYLDLLITNINNQNSAPVLLNYNQVRDTALLKKPSDYEMSIVKFQLGTTTLPVFTPIIQYQSTNTNLTIYSITLEYTDASSNTFTQQEYVIYSPQNKSIQVPQPPSVQTNGIQNNQNTYYNIYNYQYWIYLVNQTFTTCFNNLLASAGTLPTAHAPVMTFDTTNGIAILNVDIAGYDNTSSSPYIKIYFNQPMYELFNSFPVVIQNLATVTDGKNALIDTNTFSLNNVIQFPPYNPTYNAIQIFQEMSTCALWSPISSIVFTSSSIPVVQSATASPVNYVNGQILVSNSTNNLYTNLLTDFSDISNYKPQILYEPTAEYRFLSLTGETELRNIQISVFYRDKLGGLNEFYLSNGNSFSCKILFRKKSRIK